MATIYVTGHRNPDMDSIAAAMGYAELKRRLNPADTYIAARLGDPNGQTLWALKKSSAKMPEYLPHIMLRVRDVMRTDFPSASHTPARREGGLKRERAGVDVPRIPADSGALAGMLTARALARRYIRETSEPASFE